MSKSTELSPVINLSFDAPAPEGAISVSSSKVITPTAEDIAKESEVAGVEQAEDDSTSIAATAGGDVGTDYEEETTATVPAEDEGREVAAEADDSQPLTGLAALGALAPAEAPADVSGYNDEGYSVTGQVSAVNAASLES